MCRKTVILQAGLFNLRDPNSFASTADFDMFSDLVSQSLNLWHGLYHFDGLFIVGGGEDDIAQTEHS
jgi:hypothetical protein